METCPYCGAAKRAGEKSWARFECNYLVQDGAHFIRPPSCYERQLAQQADLIERALEVVELLSWAGCDCTSERKFPIYPGENSHKEECIVGKAQTLLADLEAAIKSSVNNLHREI